MEKLESSEEQPDTPPTYQSPPLSPRRKSVAFQAMAWTIGGVALMGLVVVYSMNSPKSNIKPDAKIAGSNMTRAELDEASGEMTELMKDADPNDPNSLNTNAPVKSRVAKKLQEVALESRERDAQAEKALAGVDMDKALTGEEIGSPEGRRRSQASLEKYDDAMSAYLTAGIKQLDSLMPWMQQELGQVPEMYKEVQSETKEMLLLHQRFVKSTDALLALADKGNATYDAKQDLVVFKSDKDTKDFYAHYASVMVLSERMQKLQEQGEQRKSQMRSKALEQLNPN